MRDPGAGSTRARPLTATERTQRVRRRRREALEDEVRQLLLLTGGQLPLGLIGRLSDVSLHHLRAGLYALHADRQRGEVSRS